jgi:hypothetical protein
MVFVLTELVQGMGRKRPWSVIYFRWVSYRCLWYQWSLCMICVIRVPGADIVEKFNRKHDFDLIVRAHQVKMNWCTPSLTTTHVFS